MTARDFPKSLGSSSEGLKRFKYEDIESHIQHLAPHELLDVRAKLNDLAPTGFQIWGIPAGAEIVLRNMKTGDFLMLLESTDFRYAGQVLHRTSGMCHELSARIWGENRFPIIILLQGEMISYGWSDFVDNFGFNPKYHMRGTTMSLSSERVQNSQYKTEENFIAHLSVTMGSNPFDQATDFSSFANNLVSHYRLVKAREKQEKFRKDVFYAQGARCAVCDFDILSGLEAAHIIPVENDGSNDPRNGLVLCATHHRLFDANVFSINPDSFDIISRSGFSRERIRLTVDNLRMMDSFPHKKALQWRWDNYKKDE
ncbi:HNH endonuclease [Ferrovibrio xuzhouensis]|uniref:HNH endonuclease n=1 Tax=Ferrovibrio xuzhouensis TaxID=1576914 RepID=A0ABV7VFW7_9PROT